MYAHNQITHINNQALPEW